jgi:hypothetical protein
MREKPPFSIGNFKWAIKGEVCLKKAKRYI